MKRRKLERLFFHVLAITLTPDMVRGEGIGPSPCSPYECNPYLAFVSLREPQRFRAEVPLLSYKKAISFLKRFFRIAFASSETFGLNISASSEVSSGCH